MADDTATSPVPTGSSATPEFHVVVRRPDGRGPLGPYRLVIAVAFAALVAGGPIWRGIRSGDVDDALLLLALGSAAFVWFVLGVINRILASAPSPRSGGRPTAPTA